MTPDDCLPDEDTDVSLEEATRTRRRLYYQRGVADKLRREVGMLTGRLEVAQGENTRLTQRLDELELVFRHCATIVGWHTGLTFPHVPSFVQRIADLAHKERTYDQLAAAHGALNEKVQTYEDLVRVLQKAMTQVKEIP
jgi:uncharacterized protein YhaN